MSVGMYYGLEIEFKDLFVYEWALDALGICLRLDKWSGSRV